MFRDSPVPRGSDTSYSPPPGDSMVVNSDEMRVLMQHRREVDESLAQLEVQIFHEEGSYIKETPCGNVVRGFESFHDSKLNIEQPKKSRAEIMEERIFSKSSFLFWQRSRERAAEAEQKKREQQQAMIANRGMYMGVGGSNGAAAGVGHVKPLSYGTYGSSLQGGGSHPGGGGASTPASNHQAGGSGNSSGHTSHKKRHPDERGHGHGHKKKKKKRSSSSSNGGYGAGGGLSQSGGGGGGDGTSVGSTVSANHFDPI